MLTKVISRRFCQAVQSKIDNSHWNNWKKMNLFTVEKVRPNFGELNGKIFL